MLAGRSEGRGHFGSAGPGGGFCGPDDKVLLLRFGPPAVLAFSGGKSRANLLGRLQDRSKPSTEASIIPILGQQRIGRLEAG